MRIAAQEKLRMMNKDEQEHWKAYIIRMRSVASIGPRWKDGKKYNKVMFDIVQEEELFLERLQMEICKLEKNLEAAIKVRITQIEKEEKTESGKKIKIYGSKMILGRSQARAKSQLEAYKKIVKYNRQAVEKCLA